MKIEVGMYVRTKDGEIYKCVIIHKDNINSTLDRFMNEWGNMIMFDEILKASHNIIDLIEVGDFVNGKLIHSIQRTNDNAKLLEYGNGKHIKEIKSILTHEQYEANCYKVVE